LGSRINSTADRIPTPHHYRQARDGESEEAFSKRCADDLEALILAEGPDTVAAFIGEPVLGTGGIVPPPKGYWAAIQAVLDKYDILLIADEVVCGFARTGEKFGSHLYGMRPDLVTIAKGVSSAYLPISGSIIGDRVWSVLEEGTEKHGALGHGRSSIPERQIEAQRGCGDPKRPGVQHQVLTSWHLPRRRMMAWTLGCYKLCANRNSPADLPGQQCVSETCC
jgi:adenosylmethionine-8-amino-7-oxononanoate aminotransferase